MTEPVLGFVGMTHLGLSSAIAAAEKGVRVVCYDTGSALVEELAKGNLPINEPQCADLLQKNRANISFTSDAQALRECDLIYVAPDVATDDEGNSDLSAIDTLLDVAVRHVGSDSVIVILSQVPPGYTRRHREEFPNLFYQVETLVFGRAMERALYPERFIIGVPEAEVELPEQYAAFLALFDCPQLLMRYESAELAKISINCCLVASISTANTLAELCEKIGADWSEIAPALKLDARIGPNAYLAPGLGIAGGNLERDLATVLRYAKAHDTDAGVVSAWLANSRHRKEWPYRRLHAKLLKNDPAARIAVLGLAYKENTHSVKNSPALALINQLAVGTVSVYDPVVPGSAAPGARAAKDMLSALNGADAVAIMTPWDEFRALDPAKMRAAMKGRLVLDPFRVLESQAVQSAGLDYETLGVSQPGQQHEESDA